MKRKIISLLFFNSKNQRTRRVKLFFLSSSYLPFFKKEILKLVGPKKEKKRNKQTGLFTRIFWKLSSILCDRLLLSHQVMTQLTPGLTLTPHLLALQLLPHGPGQLPADRGLLTADSLQLTTHSCQLTGECWQLTGERWQLTADIWPWPADYFALRDLSTSPPPEEEKLR